MKAVMERRLHHRMEGSGEEVVGVHDVIIHSNFGFNIFRSFRSTGGQNFRVPFHFAGHRFNSADATAQPVMNAPA